MKKNNADQLHKRKGCAQRKDYYEKKEEGRKISGHELLPPSTLRDVGKKVPYNRGFRLGAGSESYREMSAVVADMAWEVGHDLYRRGKKKAAQFLLGLPDNEYLAICYSAYRHDKRLPSVALVDTTQTAANLKYHYETKVRGRDQFVALTVPALEDRVSIDGYEAGVTLAFRRINKLKVALKASGFGEFIYVQLEAPFDPEKQTFYLHFHIFLTFGLGGQRRRQALAFIKENTPWLDSKAGVYLKCIAGKDVARSIRYGTKPSTTAYEIAASENKEVLEAYLNVSKGRRLTRTEGALKVTIKTLRQEGLRTIFHKREHSGPCTVALIETRTKKDPVRPDPRNAISNDKLSNAAKNIYCGSGRPISSPEGRLLAFGYVQDFCEDSLDLESDIGVVGSLFEANRIARQSWEENTGRSYDLREFLVPIADDVMRLINSAEVQSYTVIASPTVLKTLHEIQDERELRVRKNKKDSSGSADAISFWGKFKLWRRKLFSGISWLQTLTH